MKLPASLKILSVIISAAILMVSLPLYAFAVDNGGNVAGNGGFAPEESSEEEFSPYNGRIIEVEENRAPSDKTFRLSDGSFFVAHYNTNVHEEDESGKLTDIDNRLYLSNGSFTTGKGNKTFPEYPKESSPIFSLSSKDSFVSFTLEGDINTSARGEISNKETEFEKDATDLDRLITLDHILSTVTYRDILPGTDIEYVLHGSDVKENIILKSRPENAAFSFILTLEGLEAELSESGDIILSDGDGRFRYRIPRAVMWDGKNEFSDGIETVFEQIGEGEYRTTYIPDAEWLDSAERQYPVILDPSVYAHSSNVTDLGVSTDNPYSSSPGDDYIYISGTWRAYWKMNSLIPLPSHCRITNATITLNCFTSNEVLDGYVGVYDVTSDWTSSLTWQNVSDGVAGVPASTFTDNRLLKTYNPDGNGYYLDHPDFLWNVTPIVSKWYEGDNYGMMFQPASGTFTGTARFRSNDYTTSSVRPQLSITYVDMKGLEDYWTFTKQDAGFAGSGCVNNTTGNLVWTIPTLTSTDAVMPVTPALVYNFCTDFADYCYPNVQSGNVYSITAKGFKLNINETLIKKNFSGPDNSLSEYFILADGDGTEHYFLPDISGNTYHDEDGLLLTLAPDSGKYTITDSSKTVKTYKSINSPATGVAAYALESIRDKSGNKVIIDLDTTANYQYRPLSVKLKPNGFSGEITQLKLLYNSLGKLFCVYNPNSGDGVVFRYSENYWDSIATVAGGLLRQTVRAHGGTTDAAWENFYNTNSNSNYGGITVDGVADYTYNYLSLLSKVTNNLTGYNAGYSTYYSKRICSVYEQAGTNNTQGQELYYQYGTSSTRIQSSGADDIFDNSDDVWTTFVFDSAGRCFNSYTTDMEGTVMYGASGGQYVGDDNPKAKNNVKTSVITTQHSSNYLLNGGFEGGSGMPYWAQTGSAVLLGTEGAVNEKKLALKLNSSVSQSSVSQYVDLNRGDYTLSADFSSSQFPSGVTVYLKAESTTDSAHSVTKRIPVNSFIASDGVYSDALQFAAVPSYTGGTEQFRITISISGSVSGEVILTADNVVLSKTRGSSEYDLVSLGHFETGNGVSPSSFWSIPYVSGSITTADSGNPLFGKVLKVDYSPDEFPVVTQTVYQASAGLRESFDNGDYSENDPVLFTFSGWAKGTGQSYSSDSFFCIDLEIKYYTGGGYYSTATETIEFDRGITDWQFASDGFMSTRYNWMIDSVKVLLYYTGHEGVGYFDDVTVTIDGSTTKINSYNASGYLTESRNGKGGVSLTYNSNNDIVKSVNTASRTVVDYEYDSVGRILTQTQSRYSENNPSTNLTGICRTTYTYNACGLVTNVLCEDLEDTSLKTQTSVEYCGSEAVHIYGTVKSETDVLGNVTRYFHDSQNGRLAAVIAPNNKGTTYTYDGMGRIISVLPATYSGSTYSQITNSAYTQYGYDAAGRLSSITTRTGTTATSTYNFTYDVFGKGTGVSVGNRQLASFTYNTQNGKLNTIVYGNGLNVRYAYDEYERISEILYRNGSSGSFTTAFRYTYDAAGNLYSVEDTENHEITVNDYDSSGTLRSSVTYNSTNYYNKYGVHCRYDDESRLSGMDDSFDYRVGSGYSQAGNSYTFDYTDEGNVNKLEIYDVNYLAIFNPNYDNLGRADTRTITAGTSANVPHFYNSISFTYAASGAYSTGRITQLNSVIKASPNSSAVSNLTYSYVYDQNGNVTEIRNSANVVQYKYTYDNLGQLIREDNRPLWQSYVYTYDLNGNRTSKTTYSFTTGTLGSAQNTVSYTYGDSVWRDLLTKVGSNTNITYDNCGNPTQIGYYSLSWQGRQLRSRYDGQYETLSFGYNADGTRVYKEEYEEEPGYSVRHEYTVSGSRIIRETVFYDNSEIFTLIFSYDENGSPAGYRFRRPYYSADVYDYFYFEKNLQGDVVSVYGPNGTLLVSYTYDAWGKCYAEFTNDEEDEYWDNPGEYFNPFRYRSYYYDTETGWYYLHSRYYCPEWGRFINADSVDVMTASETSLTDKNLFVYCDNNPVNRSDDGGEFWHILAGAAIGAIGGAISSIISQAVSGEDINWKAVGISAASGAISGAITAACPCMGPIATGLVQGSLSAATYAATEKIAYGRDPSVKDVVVTGVVSGVMSGTMKYVAQEAGFVQCFIAGTLVATGPGLIPIENVEPGDLVWATDPDTGETALKTVVRTFRNESEELVHLTVNGEEIVTTPGHPFWVPTKGWTKAVHLRAGDRLQLLNGEYVVVEQVQHELLEDPVFVYNFEVEDFHTYYVGTDSVLVHNIGCKNPEHGNSLKTSKPAQGYILKDRTTNEILKYGETTRGYQRYSDAYLTQKNAYMEFVKSGTKAEMHEWQHKMIEGYVAITGQLPPLNHSLW